MKTGLILPSQEVATKLLSCPVGDCVELSLHFPILFFCTLFDICEISHHTSLKQIIKDILQTLIASFFLLSINKAFRNGKRFDHLETSLLNFSVHLVAHIG